MFGTPDPGTRGAANVFGPPTQSGITDRLAQCWPECPIFTSFTALAVRTFVSEALTWSLYRSV